MIKGVEELKRFIEEKGVKHFKAWEFKCPHCGEVLIDPFLVILLEEFRTVVGRPVIVTSAYRCEEYNRAIGGVPNSAHTKGYAMDVAVPDSRFRHTLMEFLLKNGIKRIGVAWDFIHFDVDPDKPQEVLWVYGRRKHVA